MTTAKLKKIIKLTTICVTAFVAVMVCVITYQCIKIGTLNAKLKHLDSISQNLSQQQEQLQHGIDYSQTSSYLEQQAREEYGMAQQGDTIYVQK